MQDVEVWKTMKDAEGHSFFFDPGAKNEIRLGVSFGMLYYSYSTMSLSDIAQVWPKQKQLWPKPLFRGNVLLHTKFDNLAVVNREL